jgi:hypothetical protein
MQASPQQQYSIVSAWVGTARGPCFDSVRGATSVNRRSAHRIHPAVGEALVQVVAPIRRGQGPSITHALRGRQRRSIRHHKYIEARIPDSAVTITKNPITT